MHERVRSHCHVDYVSIKASDPLQRCTYRQILIEEASMMFRTLLPLYLNLTSIIEFVVYRMGPIDYATVRDALGLDIIPTILSNAPNTIAEYLMDPFINQFAFFSSALAPPLLMASMSPSHVVVLPLQPP